MKEIKVAEVKVEKDVILQDNLYYIHKLFDELEELENSLNLGRGKLYEFAFGRILIAKFTSEFISGVSGFSDEDYIDEAIKVYNDALNYVIRDIINKERDCILFK